jgi:PAS domain S-box-containing protein
MVQKGVKKLSYYLWVMLLTVPIFLLDIVIPRGHNEWILYFFPLYLLTLTNRFLVVFLFTILISILLYIGTILSPPGIALWSSLLNRTSALMTFWAAVLILRSRSKTLNDLKKSSLELFKSRKWLERIIDATPDVIFIYDIKKDHVTYCNDQVTSVLGYTQEEFLSLSKMALEHPDDVESVKKFYHRFSQEHINSVLESIHRISHKNGTYRWVQVRALPFSYNQDGTVTDVIGIIHDITQNKTNEQALKESEKSYRQLIETSNSIIMRWDSEGTICYVNDFGLRFFGYTRDELIGKEVKTIIPVPERSAGIGLPLLVNDILQHPDQYTSIPNENIKKNGETVWVAWTNSAIVNENGVVKEILTIGNDITELKKVQFENDRSRRWLERITDTTPDVIYIYDVIANKTLYVNGKIAQFMGYTPEEIKNFDDVLAVVIEKTDLPKVINSFAVLKNAKQGDIQTVTYKIVNKDSTLSTVEARVTPFSFNEYGGVKEVLGIVRDISDIVNAQNELSERTALLDAAIDAIADGLMIYDNKGRIIRQNRVADEIFRYPEESYLKPIEERVKSINLRTKNGDPMSIDDFPSNRALKKLEIVRNVEMVITNRFGQTFMLNASAAPIIYKDGSPHGAVGTFFDMTLLYQLERQRETFLKETQENRFQLQQLNEYLEVIVSKRTEQVRSLSKALILAEYRERKRFSQILHENLQQVLFGVKIQIEQIKPEENDREKCPEHTPEIQYSLRLIEKALKITRSMSTELNPPVLENQGLDVALSWLSAHMKRTYNLSVDLKLSKTIKNIRDETLIMIIQMVRELLTNIVKHSGVLKANLEAVCQNGLISINISDLGRGFIIEDVSKRKKDELRMGLFSVEERIKLFDGTFSIVSQPGYGTICKITLPYENC